MIYSDQLKIITKKYPKPFDYVLTCKGLFYYFIFVIKYYAGYKKPYKLHLGCGPCHLNGFINIDLRGTIATDVVCNIIKLPFHHNSISSIETYHVIEHLPHPIVPSVIKYWHDLLESKGRLVIECPDFDQTVREYLQGNESRIYNIFGLQNMPGDTHLFGYNFVRIKKLLEVAGFSNIQMKPPTDYHASLEPCMRIEAIKG